MSVLQQRERSDCYFTKGVGIFKTSNKPLLMQGCLIREAGFEPLISGLLVERSIIVLPPLAIHPITFEV
jgi:hypothetical protein